MQFWTATHAKTLLPSLALMLIAVWLLHHLLKGREERVRSIPFQIVAVLIGLLEIAKQVISLRLGYKMWHLPLHVCSVIGLFLPLTALYRGRYRGVLRGATTALLSALFSFMVIAPNAIYTVEAIEDSLKFFTQSDINYFFDFHTVAFHELALLALLLIYALDLHQPEPRRDVLATATVMLCYTPPAAVAANVLQTNFHNFYYCVFTPIELLRLRLHEVLGASLGQVLYVILHATYTSLGIVAAYFLYCLLVGVRHRVSQGRGVPPTEEEQITAAAQGILDKHRAAFEELAK